MHREEPIVISDIPINDETKFVDDGLFFINDMMCVSMNRVMKEPIRIGENVPEALCYSLLFALHQDVMDKYCYMMVNFITYRSTIEKLRFSGLYIEDIKKDKENKAKLDQITSHLTHSNLYTVDFNINKDVASEYCLTGYRMTGKNIYNTISFKFDEKMLFRITYFLYKFRHAKLDIDIFLDSKFNDIKTFVPDNVVLDGSMEKSIDNDNSKLVYSHYTFNNGPSKVKANYLVNCNSDNKILREPLIDNQYFAHYKEDPEIMSAFLIEELDMVFALVLLNQKGDMTLLKLKKEVYQNTNLIDPTNYVYYDKFKKVPTNTVVPHLKF